MSESQVRTRITITAALLCLSALIPAAPARAFEAGGHLGVGLDSGSVHLGGDLLFPLVDVSSSVKLSIWPSAAFIIADGPEGVLLSCDARTSHRLAGESSAARRQNA